MPKTTKQTIVVILLGLGFSLFLYGFTLNILPVYNENNDKGFATQERQLVLEVSRGGLKRDAEGKLRKTYTGAPPKACPT